MSKDDSTDFCSMDRLNFRDHAPSAAMNEDLQQMDLDTYLKKHLPVTN